MRYHIARVLHQLYFYRGRYLTIWLELLAGAVLLSVCTNKLLTSNEAMRAFEKSMRGGKTVVQYEYRGDSYMDTYLPVGYESYQTIRQEFSDALDLSFASWIYAGAFLETDTVEISLVFMDDTCFAELFGPGRQTETAYVGENAGEGLQKLRQRLQAGADAILFPEGLEFGLDGTDFLFQGMCAGTEELPETDASELIKSDFTLFDTGEQQLLLSDCVILPAAWMSKIDFFRENGVICPCVLRIGQPEGGADFPAMNRLTDRLNELNTDFVFHVSDQYLEMQAQRTDMDWSAMYWLRIAVIVLLLVGGSLTGILLVLVFQRRRLKAVACLCGSTRLWLEIEMLMEMILLFASAVIPGAVIAWRLIAAGRIRLLPLDYYAESNLILLAVSGLILLAVYVLAGVVERRIPLMQVLKGD